MNNTAQNNKVPVKELMQERKRWLFFALPFTFTTYTLTNKKLVVNEGLLVSHENEILLYRILDMSYSRSLIQKIFGLGNIKLDSQDVSSPVFVIRNIKHSKEFKEMMSEAIENEKLRLSVRRGEVIGMHGGMPNDGAFDDGNVGSGDFSDIPDAPDGSFNDDF